MFVWSGEFCESAVWIVLTLGIHQLKLGTHLNLFNCHHKHFNRNQTQIGISDSYKDTREENAFIFSSKLSGHMYSYHWKLQRMHSRGHVLMRSEFLIFCLLLCILLGLLNPPPFSKRKKKFRLLSFNYSIILIFELDNCSEKTCRQAWSGCRCRWRLRWSRSQDQSAENMMMLITPLWYYEILWSGSQDQSDEKIIILFSSTHS